MSSQSSHTKYRGPAGQSFPLLSTLSSFNWWASGILFLTEMTVWVPFRSIMALLLSKEIMLAKRNYARKNCLTYRIKNFPSDFVISSTSSSSFSHKTNLCGIFSYMTDMDYVSERQDLGMGSNRFNSLTEFWSRINGLREEERMVLGDSGETVWPPVGEGKL